MGPNKRNEADKPEKSPEKGEGYRKYTISELRRLLRDRGIQFAWKHKKDDLIKLLYETDINKKQLSTKHNDETDPDGSFRYAERVERITSDMRTLDLYHDDQLCKVFDEARRLQREWDHDRARKAQELKDEAKLYQRRSEKMVSRANFKGDKQEVKRLTGRQIHDASNNFAQHQNGFEQRWRARSTKLLATYAKESARYVELLAKMTRDPFSDDSNPPSRSSSPPRLALEDSSLQRAARRSSPITYNLISDDEPRMTDSYGPPREQVENLSYLPETEAPAPTMTSQPSQGESGSKRKNTQPPPASAKPSKKRKQKSARDRSEGRPHIQIDYNERAGGPAPSDETLAGLKWYIESLGARKVEFYTKDRAKWCVVWENTDEGETAMWKFHDDNPGFDWNGYKIQHLAFIPRH